MKIVLPAQFQDAIRPEVIALVEQVLGQRARTFLSDHDVVQDIGLEVILLEGALDTVDEATSAFATSADGS